MSAVGSSQRHTRSNRCIVCDGADGDPRGKGKRCSGFVSSDGKYVHCSREELSGGLDANDAGLYAHLRNGPCRCGVTHGEDSFSAPFASNRIEATYDYRDEHGVLLFQVVRKAGKKFLQRRPDGAGGWIWKLGDTRPVLYRLPKLVADDADRTVELPARCLPGDPVAALADVAELVAERLHETLRVSEVGAASRDAGLGRVVARFAIDVTRRMMAEALDNMKAAADALAEASAAGDPDAKDRAKKAADEARRDLDWAATSQSASRLRAMLDVAKDFASVRVSVDELDADPMLLNAKDCTVDLRTGHARRQQRSDLITKICPASYDPSARSELWDRVLRDALGDDETIAYFQRSAGYSCTGLTDEEKLFVGHGPAAGGKSTVMQAMIAALGDYARTADFETFLVQKHAGGPKNDIARLAGARFVVSIEVDQGKRLAQGLVKQLTGGDVVTARFLYSEAFEFKPQMKLWLVVNDLPHVSADDSGMWRRIERIPFEHVVPKEKRDPGVKKALCDVDTSGAAILAWLVKGAMAWQRDGLRTPARIQAATQEYRETEDHFAQFVTECCTHPTTSSCSRRDLRAAYDGWYGARGPLSQKAFNEKVRTLEGITEKTLAGVRFWVGIALRTDGFQVQKGRTETESTNLSHARDPNGGLCGNDLDPAPPAPDDENAFSDLLNGRAP